MKQNLVKLIIIFFTISGYSQSVINENFENNFNDLLQNLNNENWIKAEKLSTDLLNFAEKIDTMDTEKKVLRYIKIYTDAGLLNEKSITKKEALEKTENLKGK